MESMKMTGDTDRDFATMMKAHHQGAIDMAQMELQNGNDAKCARWRSGSSKTRRKKSRNSTDGSASASESRPGSLIDCGARSRVLS